jgi:hypothetical protein
MMNKIACSAASCRIESVGTIDRYGDAPYCYAHLMALAAMNKNRRPKPTITFFPGFEIPLPEIREKPTPMMRVNRARTFEQEEQKIRNLNISPMIPETKIPNMPVSPITKSNTQQTRESKSPQIRKWSVFIIVVLVTGGLFTWNESDQAQKAAIAELQARNLMAVKCFQIKGEDESARKGEVGSLSRQNAVIVFYDQVAKSPCVEWGDGSIYENPFFQVVNTSDNWKRFENSFRYTLERWNGIEPFSLRCADGWQSPSIGRQGACSSHGGVVSGFNENKSWSLINQFGSAIRLYPSLSELEAEAS